MLTRIIDIHQHVYNAEGGQLSPRDLNGKFIGIRPRKRLQARINRFVLRSRAACRRSRTAGGVGVFRHPPLWLKPGDVVEVEISRIGTLRNVVVDEVASDEVRDATVARKSQEWNPA